MAPCVFLDRDGVLNEDRVDYVYRMENLVIPEGVVDALRQLKQRGYLLIVVTNQSGIAKGLYGRSAVRAIHEHLQLLSGNALDALYFCPYHPGYDTESLRRKPDSLMLEQAIARYDIDVARSWMVGDAERDVLAGKRAGVRTVQVTENADSLAEKTVANLREAAEYILKTGIV
ncbi:MAG: HAD family hydrolase [Ferruginibacter sp.]|nr:HAD family hydrolase [Cytophagales bacterium]